VSAFLPFIVIGITTGAVYGLAGTGLVLTYKTSGIFNLAYGALGALSVLIFYWLHNQQGLAWPVAAALVLFVLAPIEGLVLELMSRSLDNAGATLKVVATIGILLVVTAVGSIWYGTQQLPFPPFLSQSTVDIAGVNVSWQQIIVVIVAVVSSGGLYYFLRYVRMGIAMRGVVDNPDLVAMSGESPLRVRRWAWIIGCMFATMAGLLIAPNLQLDALIISELVIQAFGAAAAGYFSSLPLTFGGGLVIGLAGSIADKYVSSIPWLVSLPAGLPFIVLFIVLIVTPRARLAERRIVTALPVRKPWVAPFRVRSVVYVVLIIVACFIPPMTGVDLSIWSNALVEVILFLSLGLLVRTAGQISLCQFAFAAIGAASFSHFTGSYHIPWLLSLVLATLVAVPVGAFIAIPAIRLSGVFLALATLGFSLLVEQMLYTTSFMFGPDTNGLATPRPDVSIGAWHMGTDTGFYYVLLIFAVLTVALVIGIERSRMGRLLSALADSPTALETHGATTNVTRVLIFCISAALASLSGILLGGFFHFSTGTNFTTEGSLVLVALIVISVGGVPWYGIMSAVGFTVIPGYVTVSNISNYLQILFGVSAATFAMAQSHAAGVPLRLRRFLDRIGGRPPELDAAAIAAGVARAEAATESAVALAAEDAGSVREAGVSARPAAKAARAPTPGLAIENLSVFFGGVKAVRDVSMAAPIGLITGLIGPNGAGKTTTFNACSGLQRPTSGKVYFRGEEVTGLGAAQRARRGLGRTFQRAELFNSLTVRENVSLGREASMAGANPLSQLFMRRGERSTVKDAVDEAIELTGIEALSKLQAGLLPTGQRRLVELARALAGPFELLLLDEPSAGLDGTETVHFGEVLLDVVADRGTGVLLVEHDMALVRQVCQNIYVLDFGLLIFEGTSDEMLASEVVREAYLGSSSLTAEVALEEATAVDGLGADPEAVTELT
jgi:ABC-type branched-subunit amino acid transport system ATPase component/branched-subunit amino acid ABC-type transport system permease component